ncbi:MAG: DUF4249 domain-containing protein [Bacteroidota bacterium]
MRSSTIAPWKGQTSAALLLTTIMVLLVSSCQKIVNIDLNSATPRFVIEGVITDSLGPYQVMVTKSGSYFDQPVLPPVSGAFVTIADDHGNLDTLAEKQAGVYFSSKIKGIPGYNYSLKVIAENNEYDAYTSMKSRVAIDSLTIEETQGPSGKKHRNVICHFHDPQGEKNYYRIKFYTSGKTNSENYRLYDDQYTDGENIDLRAGNAEMGDTDVVVLMSIDKSAFDYYHTLEEILRTNPFFGSTPANPNTNLTNGALGYFAACMVSVKPIIIR